MIGHSDTLHDEVQTCANKVPKPLMRVSPTTSVFWTVLIDLPKALVHVQLASWDPVKKDFAFNSD